MNEIILYPGNWLYNAGVVGFLRVLSQIDYVVEDRLTPSGEVRLSGLQQALVSQQISVGGVTISRFAFQFFREGWEKLLSEEKKKGIEPTKDHEELIRKVWGTLFNVYYRGFFNANSNQLFTGTKTDPTPLLEKFNCLITRAIAGTSTPGDISCSFCQENDVTFEYKNRFSSEHSRFLGASSSERGMPNTFWHNDIERGMQICDRCSFMLLCSHLAFVPLADRTKIFLNAPSFQVMWHLRRLVEELYEEKQIASAREILGMSLIELALRLQIQLGVWTGMNIEIVSRQWDEVSRRWKEFSFYTLPYEVVQLLLDREVASLLSEIGELSIVRMVLDRQFRQILEVGERLLVIALKPEKTWGKQERQYVNDNIHLEQNKKAENLAAFSYQLFSLYALIQEKIGGDEW